jgi:hypothetical protein
MSHTDNPKYEKLEEALSRRAAQHGYEKDSPQWKRYVWGSLRILGDKDAPKVEG